MPQYLQSLIPEKIGTKRPQLKNPDNFYSMRSRIETYRLSFIPSSVRLYNSLDIVDRSFEYVNSPMKDQVHPCFTMAQEAVVLNMHSTE